MKRFVIIFMATVLLASNAHATCAKGSSTLFYCMTNKGKRIEVCDAGQTISYSFGKPQSKPEIALSVPRAQATTNQWNGFGRYMTYTVEIPNGNTTYSVYVSADKISSEHRPEAGVNVLVSGTFAASVKCSEKSIDKGLINNLEGVDLKPAE